MTVFNNFSSKINSQENKLEVFEVLYLIFATLFFSFALFNLWIGLYYFALIKFVAALLIIIFYFYQKKNKNKYIRISMSLLVAVEIQIYSIFTYHFYDSSYFWLILAPIYFFVFRDIKLNYFLFVIFIFSILSIPILNGQIPEKYILTDVEQYKKDTLNTLTFISIFIINFFLVKNFSEILSQEAKKLSKKNTELKKTQDELLSTQNYKEKFFANISHEIRTPLNAIIGISNLLEKGYHPNLVEPLQSSSKHLISIVNDFLEYNKLKKGYVNINHSPFFLRDMIKKVQDILHFQIEEKSLNFEVIVDDNIPMYISSDEKRIVQILVNLIGNSIKFTHEGYIRFIVKANHILHNTFTLSFEIIDTGVGIDSSRLPFLFEPQSDKYMIENLSYNSFGLGLLITKSLVDAFSGTIEVKSTLGEGTTFKVNLPMKISSELQVEKTKLKKSAITKKNLSILLVDDNQTNLLVAKKQLEHIDKDIKITTANNGLRAIELAKKEYFDLILMDIRMPLINGIEAAKKINIKNDTEHKVPIIAITADITHETINECYEAGIQDIVSKPFIIEELIGSINSVIK